MTTKEETIKNKPGTSEAGKYRYLHLFVLSVLAFAQPLFDILSKNAEFFVARGSKPFDVILLTISLTLIIPAILCAIEYLIGLLGKWLQEVLHFVFITVLIAVILPSQRCKLSGRAARRRRSGNSYATGCLSPSDTSN